MLTKIINFINIILNFKKIYFNNKDFAFDEIIKDPRSFLMKDRHLDKGGKPQSKFEDYPNEFILEDNRRLNQGRTSYCTAFGLSGAMNSELKIKADNTFHNGFDIANIMIREGILSKNGASTFRVVQRAKQLGIIDRYYQADTNIDMMEAICAYQNPICTGSNKINWGKFYSDGLITDIEKGNGGHSFCIIGFNKTKKIGKYTGGFYCKNSRGEKIMDRGGFWVPFDLADKTFHYSKKAIVIHPKWSKKY